MLPNPSPRPWRVAVEGFSDFERAALASFFRLAGQRQPAYEPVASAEGSDFLIADADRLPVRDRIARDRRTADTVFVGARPPEDAVAWLARPIEPVRILRALDGLLGERERRGSTQPTIIAAPLRAPSGPTRSAATAPRGGAGRPALVVDPSPIARAFLAQRLGRLGYRVTSAASGEAALDLAARQAFGLVFVDLGPVGPGSVDAGGLDALQVCQRLKQRPAAEAPAVVVTTGCPSATDRVRATLAGCDAYLVKPLLAAGFGATLRQVDPLFG